MEVRDDHGSVRKAQVFPDYNARHPRGIVKNGKIEASCLPERGRRCYWYGNIITTNGYARLPRDLPEHRRQGHHRLPGIVSGGCRYPTGQKGVVEAAPTPVNVWHFRLRCRFSFGVEVDLRVVVQLDPVVQADPVTAPRALQAVHFRQGVREGGHLGG